MIYGLNAYPVSGAALKIPASTVPKFVAGAKFKAAVDPKAAKRKALERAVVLAERQPQQQVEGVSEQTTGKRRKRAFIFSHEALAAKRKAFGMTQKEMARLLGVSSLSGKRARSHRARRNWCACAKCSRWGCARLASRSPNEQPEDRPSCLAAKKMREPKPRSVQ